MEPWRYEAIRMQIRSISLLVRDSPTIRHAVCGP